MAPPRYDRIGQGYSGERREDPGWAGKINTALGPARTVLNVGAGAGSYEPSDRDVIALEPSVVMIGQRSRQARSSIVRGVAQRLPLADRSVDAALTVLSLHHWHPGQRRGVEELCRVVRGAIAIVTFDPLVSGDMWLMRDYLPEVRNLDLEIFPDPGQIASWLDRPAAIEVLPVDRDSPDHCLAAFWAHPERVLDPAARRATSGFARQTAEVNARVAEAVRRDLESGAWEEKNGHLRQLQSYDAGLRLISARPIERA